MEDAISVYLSHEDRLIWRGCCKPTVPDQWGQMLGKRDMRMFFFVLLDFF